MTAAQRLMTNFEKRTDVENYQNFLQCVVEPAAEPSAPSIEELCDVNDNNMAPAPCHQEPPRHASVEPTAPPLDSDNHQRFPILCATGVRYKTKGIEETKGFATVAGQLTVLHDKDFKRASGASGERYWLVHYQAMSGIMSCAELKYKNKPVACVVACDDEHYGIEYFKLKTPEVLLHSQRYNRGRVCCVASSNEVFAALCYEKKCVIVGTYSPIDGGHLKTKNFNLAHDLSYDRHDSLVMLRRNGNISIYVMSSDGVITQYTRSGEKEGPQLRYTSLGARPKLATIGDHLLVIDPAKKRPQIWDHHNRSFCDLPVDSSSVPASSDVIDLVSDDSSVWIVYKKKGSASEECVQYSLQL